MTKIRIVYSKTPREFQEHHDAVGTTHVNYDADEKFTQSTDFTSIVFDIVNSKYSDIFLDQWHKAINRNNIRRMQYNTYDTLSVETYLQCQEELNGVISSINESYPEYTIPSELILEVDENKTQLDKLNALHEYFEDTSKLNDASENKSQEMYVFLDRINFLVHRLERGYGGHDQKLTVVRCAGPDVYYKLKDEDYEYFEEVRPNVLYIDFATVGKDFYACFHTNDVELIKSNKVSPQGYIKPCMNFTISSKVFSDERYDNDHITIKEKARVWLEENNLTEFTSVDLPKNTNGRIRLGTLSEHISFDSFDTLTRQYPYIWGVYIE